MKMEENHVKQWSLHGDDSMFHRNRSIVTYDTALQFKKSYPPE